MKRWFLIWGCFLVLSLGVYAQATCSDIVFDAIEQVDQLCQDVGRNQMCYGNRNVTITPLAGVSDLLFDNPGNIESLTRIAGFEVAPFDLVTQSWGISVLKVQGNLPDTTPGVNATILVFGDVSMEANEADGRMQSFALTTGIGEVGCNELPENGIMIHTPEGVAQVAFNINGVDIAMGSTLFIQSNETMDVAVLEGQAEVTSGGASEVVEAGQQVILPVEDDGMVAEPPPPPVNLSDDDLRGLPLSLLPEEIVVETSTPAPSVPSSSGSYIVQPGDTLFRIALRCGISLTELAEANGITDPTRIFSGQRLILPACNGVAFTSTTPVATAVPGTVDNCSPDIINYCYPGQPWGDGRCDTGDPATTDYMYKEGWYEAALACGAIDSRPSTSSGGSGSGSCVVTAVYGLYGTTMSYDVSWSPAYSGQAQIFFDIDITRYGSTTHYAFTDSISSSAQSFSKTENRVNEGFEKGFAVITDSSGNSLSSQITCVAG